MLGIDLVEVKKIKKFIDSKTETALLKVFTQKEIDYADSSKNRYQRYAARFAVKEAFYKAFGFGELNQIEYSNYKITLYGKTLAEWQALSSPKIEVSVTHTDDYAAAAVLSVK